MLHPQKSSGDLLQTNLVILDFELLILALVAPSNLLNLGDSLVFLLHLRVAVFQVLLHFVSLRRQTCQRVSESLQLVLSRITAGVGPVEKNLGYFYSDAFHNRPERF